MHPKNKTKTKSKHIPHRPLRGQTRDASLSGIEPAWGPKMYYWIGNLVRKTF